MPKISELVEKTNLLGSEFVAIQDANVTKKASLASIGSILGGGGASVTVSDTAPVAENEGDLWYTPTDGALYVWITGSLNAWVQTNGGGTGGGASVTVSDTAPADAGEGDLWFDDVNATLYVYLAGTTNAWIQISGGGQSGATGTVPNMNNSQPGQVIPLSTITLYQTGDTFSYGLAIPAGKWLVHIQAADNSIPSSTSGNVDEDWHLCIAQVFDVPSGMYLRFGHKFATPSATNTTFGYWLSTSSAAPTSLTNFTEFTTNATGNNQAVAYTDADTWTQGGTTPGCLYNWSSADGPNGLSNWSGFALNVDGGLGTSGGSGGASVTASNTAPTAPGDGDLWFDTSVMELYVYVAAESSWIQTNGGGGSGGSFSTGWVNQDKNGVAVDVNTRLEFDHNLGTTDFVVKVYQANDANGTDAREVSDYFWNAASEFGSRVHDITSTSLAIEFGAGGDYNLNLAAVGSDTTSSLAGNWIKVVCVAGGGGSGGDGPRAYVAFDGASSNLFGSITNSKNIASITDNSTGNYTITYTSPVANPVITIGHDRGSLNSAMDPCYVNVTSTSFDVNVGESETGWPSYARDVKLSVVVH